MTLLALALDLIKLYIKTGKNQNAENELDEISHFSGLSEHEVFLISSLYFQIKEQEKGLILLKKL